MTAVAIQSWNDRAKAYAQLTRDWPIYKTLAGRLLDWLDLPEGAKVLDLGAGAGLLGEMVLQRQPGAKVYALEPAPDLLDMARHGLGRSLQGALAIPAERLIYAEMKVDACASSTAFHLMDPGLTLMGVAHVLRPGGLFVANLWWHAVKQTAAYDVDGSLGLLVQKAVEAEGEMFKPWSSLKGRALSLEDFEGLGHKAGLKLEKTQRDQDMLPLAFFADFGAMSPNWPQAMAQEKRERVLRRVREAATETVAVPTWRLKFQK